MKLENAGKVRLCGEIVMEGIAVWSEITVLKITNFCGLSRHPKLLFYG